MFVFQQLLSMLDIGFLETLIWQVVSSHLNFTLKSTHSGIKLFLKGCFIDLAALTNSVFIGVLWPTHVIESAAAGWGDLEQTRVNERSEGGGRLVFGHGVSFWLRLTEMREINYTAINVAKSCIWPWGWQRFVHPFLSYYSTKVTGYSVLSYSCTSRL